MSNPTETPASLRGKELERLCLVDADWRARRLHYTMGRYGVQVSMRTDAATGKLTMTPLSSLPDFEGVQPGGRQFILETKVTSGASFPLNDDKFKRRQLSHMLIRSRYQVRCLLLIHFNARHLRTRDDPAATWAFPVQEDHPFWEEFDRGEVKSISRTWCAAYGIRVQWWIPKGSRVPRPNLLEVLETKCSFGASPDITIQTFPSKTA